MQMQANVDDGQCTQILSSEICLWGRDCSAPHIWVKFKDAARPKIGGHELLSSNEQMKSFLVIHGYL